MPNSSSEAARPWHRRVDLALPAVLGLGGGIGALARYELSLALPAAPAGFPRATVLTNVLGCLLIGVLMVVVTEVIEAHRLLRPFIGVGVLGGFTTFSGYVADSMNLLLAGKELLACGALFGTVALALLSVLFGVWLARWLFRVEPAIRPERT